MRICLTSAVFPPDGRGGIPRQRYILAQALTALGHEVHVIVQGDRTGPLVQDRVNFHFVPALAPPLTFSDKHPSLNDLLNHSLGIWEQVCEINQHSPLDVLDAPLWGLEGFVPIYAGEMPVVLWLQTSRAHLVALADRQPNVDELGVIAFEKECLKRAPAIIADSQAVVADLETMFGLEGLAARSRTIPLGLPELTGAQPVRRQDKGVVEVLLVGRLEKRKGTQLLFDLLPDLLKREKNLRVRFVGEDNSQWDGFQDQFKLTYPEYFRRRWPRLHERVIFEGGSSEARLIEAYQQADIMLVPSLYESFGLIYLEAMRSSLPVITFEIGAAAEVFPRGEQDGALLVPPGNGNALLASIRELASDPRRRAALGQGGRQRFLASFSDSRMAEETAACYKELVETWPASRQPRPRRIFQVMESLDVGDAVSAITLRNAALLKELGAGGSILGLHAHPQLAEKIRPVRNFDLSSHTALIYHYWNFSRLEDFICNFRGPKAIHFHNITPPEYFHLGSPAYEATSRGYEQLPRIINLFDLIIGDSTFNLEVCKPFLSAPKPSIVSPPVVELDEVRAKPVDSELLARLRGQAGCRWLFVGRIVRNKRQDRLIELFDHYYQQFDDQAWLYLVGSDQGDPRYRVELETLRARLPSGDRIIFTGKVSEEALYSFYRAADVFVSASGHEGFCLPILEAMALDIPVVAYAAGATPETMGKAGILVHEWDALQIAGRVQRILQDQELRVSVINSQRLNLARFSREELYARLSCVVSHLRYGQLGPLINDLVI